MSLANMRQNGVRAVIATCEACNRSADVNVDALPETVYVPQAGARLRCSGCGGKTISTTPAWHTARDAWGRGPSFGRQNGLKEHPRGRSQQEKSERVANRSRRATVHLLRWPIGDLRTHAAPGHVPRQASPRRHGIRILQGLQQWN
jgi:hypothetical protein